MGTRRSAGAPALAPAPTLARTRTAGAILLALALHPAGAFGQWGDLRIEVGGSRAFAPSGTDVAAATYLTAGLQVDRWTRSGSGVFAAISGGMATGAIGGNWGSFVLGGEAVAGAGGPVEVSLSASTYGFTVGGPFVYEARTVVVRPEVRIPMGPVAIVLYGEGGKGSSTVEFRREDQVRVFSHALWHHGGGPELQLRIGRTLTSASYGVLKTERGTYRRGELEVRAGTDRSLVAAALRVWDTPLGTETTGIISVTVPLGGPNWFARLVGGRTDPDPLVRSEPGGQGGLIIGRRLVRFGPRGATPVVALRATSGGAAARFRVENQAAQRIEVLGDFSGWEPQAMLRDGRAWVLEIPLAAGTYHFGFLVDGEWFVPEGAPGQVSDDWGRMNATIVVP